MLSQIPRKQFLQQLSKSPLTPQDLKKQCRTEAEGDSYRRLIKMATADEETSRQNSRQFRRLCTARVEETYFSELVTTGGARGNRIWCVIARNALTELQCCY